jgi:anti-sigma regulatory factor (Ser/Thr protein kinase)
MIAIPVTEQSQVAEARRKAAALAQGAGFSEEDAGRVALVATELATNLVKHGSGGRLLAGLYDEPGDQARSGVQLVAIDKGVGIADLGAALRDGYSTAGSAGQGLGAIQRQAQAFHVFSRPGSGTAILALVAPGRPAGVAREQAWGAVSVPKSGEEVCGDGWHVMPDAGGAHTIMVVDGLGHGPQAAKAASEAVRLFKKHAGKPPAAILDALHAGLRGTRGAALAVARFVPDRQMVVFCGIGNIAGTLAAGTTTKRMVSQNGTVGHAVRKIQEFEYPYEGEPLVVMHSDGLSGSWSLASYPGLLVSHPTLIAAVLYRDFARERDDATVLVVRGPSR